MREMYEQLEWSSCTHSLYSENWNGLPVHTRFPARIDDWTALLHGKHCKEGYAEVRLHDRMCPVHLPAAVPPAFRKMHRNARTSKMKQKCKTSSGKQPRARRIGWHSLAH